MGWILVSMMFLFILPTYNLVKSYVDFEKQNQQVIKLQKEYEALEKNTKSEKKLAEQLKNDDFVKKYARAKYYLSREGEVIYPVLRVITEIMMNDIITKIETFLAYSDEKLAELEKENQRLKEDNQYTETD